MISRFHQLDSDNLQDDLCWGLTEHRRTNEDGAEMFLLGAAELMSACGGQTRSAELTR